MIYEGQTTATLVARSIGTEASETRQIVSLEESAQTEKTLIHLRGRVEELRERLSVVLTPVRPKEEKALKGGAVEIASPLTERIRGFRGVAQDSIDMIEDILDRLDV